MSRSHYLCPYNIGLTYFCLSLLDPCLCWWSLKMKMDYLRANEGKIEPLYTLSRTHHNEVIAWWGFLFMFWKLHFSSLGLMISLCQAAGTSRAGCCSCGYPEQLEVLLFSCLKRCLISAPSQIVLPWLRQGRVWNDSIGPVPRMADGKLDQLLQGGSSECHFSFLPFLIPLVRRLCKPSTYTVKILEGNNNNTSCAAWVMFCAFTALAQFAALQWSVWVIRGKETLWVHHSFLLQRAMSNYWA